MDVGNQIVAALEVVMRGEGQRALFVAETGSRARTAELLAYFRAQVLEVQPLVLGPVLACAVRVADENAELLPKLAEHLRQRYAFSLCEPGFTESLCRVAQHLARESEGELFPVERCCGCGAPEPFPSILRLTVEKRQWIARFCPQCIGDVAADPIEECRKLIQRAGGAFAPWQDAVLRWDGREGDCLRFAVLTAPEVAAASERDPRARH
ncbi:MAG TPA: hypothetical protein VHR86_01610 [Armatimonadota bacterium]|nr:hypothetical protein [Armatimonadota bacterium]